MMQFCQSVWRRIKYIDDLVCEANKYQICRILSKESLVKIAKIFQLGISYIPHFTWFSKAVQQMLKLQKSQYDAWAQSVSCLHRLHILEVNTAISILAWLSLSVIVDNSVWLFASRVTIFLLLFLPSKLRINRNLEALGTWCLFRQAQQMCRCL